MLEMLRCVCLTEGDLDAGNVALCVSQRVILMLEMLHCVCLTEDDSDAGNIALCVSHRG